MNCIFGIFDFPVVPILCRLRLLVEAHKQKDQDTLLISRNYMTELLLEYLKMRHSCLFHFTIMRPLITVSLRVILFFDMLTNNYNIEFWHAVVSIGRYDWEVSLTSMPESCFKWLTVKLSVSISRIGSQRRKTFSQSRAASDCSLENTKITTKNLNCIVFLVRSAFRHLEVP